ncbi:MAG: DMT family transporter, partial [Methylococcales bacterium]|nr:DMT family transporter [Methylococcales bacterium]
MQFASGLAAAILVGIVLAVASHWPSSLFAPSSPSAIEWVWLATIGLIAAVGHLLVVMGLNRAPASLLAPFGYVEIIAATALGWLIFGDWPDMLAWMGVVTIIASGVYVFYREQLLH